MNPRVRVAAWLVVGLAALAGLACGSEGRGAGVVQAREAGRRVGRALAAVVRAHREWRRPARCAAEFDGEGAPEYVLVGKRTYRREGAVLAAGGGAGAGRRNVRVGVVASARGPSPATLENLGWLRAALAKERVDVVVALGGMGDDQAALEGTLGAVASEAWLLVAMPGDRETPEAVAGAVAALAKQGVPVVDGASVRVIGLGGITIATLPGLPAGAGGRAHGLTAGVDGCAFTEDDARAIGAAAGAREGTRLLAAFAPPLQEGAGATDVGLEVVHLGSALVARAAREARAHAVVHALVDEAGGRSSAGEWLSVAAGAIDGAPRERVDGSIGAGDAIVLEIEGDRVRVKALSVPHIERAHR